MKYLNTEQLENLNIKQDNVYLVIDFDRTITTNQSEDSWDVTGKLLGQEFAKHLKNLYQKYRPIELDNKINKKEKQKAMKEWYVKCINLYDQFHLTKEKLIQSVKIGNLTFREGAKSFLKKAYQKNIPIVILSAGIGNVIEEFLKQSHCYFDNIFILANFIEFDEQGRMKKFDPNKIIHSANKAIKNKLPSFLAKRVKDRPYKILMGDLKEDINMVEEKEWNTTLKIGILENQIEENLKFYQDVFDIVLTGEDASFKILEDLIQDLNS